ncbi:uncharacterized protein TNCV_1870671 [Trichonephila clavipes]|nr:uncharacterized protein TNCV_1870671 [Trichonephila clavipes]
MNQRPHLRSQRDKYLIQPENNSSPELRQTEHDFAASKATDHDIVSDETENSAHPQTLVVENQHINPPEEPKLMVNADYDALKKPVSVFYFKLLPKATQCEEKRKSKKGSSSIFTSTPIKEMLEQREKQNRKL